uniref:Uncharacterized protein n=1 Tax=Hucho hucho TaxID=62062 RepID=A0A4W5P3V4_9TELE
MYICVCVCVCVYQAQVQRSLDSAVSLQQRAAVGRRLRKETGLGAGTDIDGQGSSPMSEQDSGVLDVEDEEDEDEVPGAQELVDFSPVYRCLHIYTVLPFFISESESACVCVCVCVTVGWS